MSVYYSSVGQYLESKTTLGEKIAAIDTLIAQLELKQLDAVASATWEEYFINDGQTQIRTRYRSMADIEAALKALETRRERYINKYNGRNIRLVDGSNFINTYPCD